MKRNKAFTRVLSLALALIILTLCVPAVSVSAITTADSSQQIQFTGGWNPPQYPVDGTLYKDRIAVSKTIAPTENENYFDITLKVVAKPRVIDQSVDVVVVMDVSNTMNYTHEGLSVGAAGYNVKDARITHAKAAVNTFLDLYSVDKNISDDRGFGLVTFNSHANTVVPITPMNTAQAAKNAKNIVNNITAPTGNDVRFTNIEGGLQLAHNLLKESDAVFKYIIFITDGFPTTYIQSSRNSKTTITGYDTYMTGSYDAKKVGTDGYFADAVTKKICTYGVNYSDKAADKADDVAQAIHRSGVNIFSIGIDVGVQSVPDYIKASNSTAFTTVDRASTNHVIGDNAQSYKAWLRDDIAGGPMIENAKNPQEINRYASGNSATELQTAFENILNAIELLPAESMEQAFTLDPMSDYVEFKHFYDLDGSETQAVINTRNGRDVATFDPESQSITWWLTTTQNFYIDELGNYVLSVSYKVRLKNEMEGFEFSKAFPTNDTTTFYFKTVDVGTGEPIYGDNHIDYLIPEVEGYVGELNFTKVDQTTRKPLEGAVFRLEHYGESCHVCDGDAIIASQTASSDEAGVVSFKNLPSGHEYALIEETPPEGYQPGPVRSVHVAYGKTYLDGKLVTESSPAVITNNEIVPVVVELSAMKTLDGRELEAGEFTFVLEGEYINKFHEKAHNDEDGLVKFHPITLDDEGTYSFKVYEEKGKDSTVLYDSKVYNIEFNVTISDDSKRYILETKVDGEDVESDTSPLPFEFTNTLRKPVGVILSADKLLDGKASPDGLFTFELEDAQGEIIDSTSTLGGTASFDEIIYTREGVYKYKIRESHICSDDEAEDTIFFDHNVYDAVVTVTAPEDSDSFKAEVVYSLDGKVIDKVVFENFTRGNASLTIKGTKTFENGTLEDGQFKFEVRKVSGKLLIETTHDAQGNFEFDKMEFDRIGYFVFMVTEAKGSNDEIAYDEMVYKIFVNCEARHNLKDYYLEVTVYQCNSEGIMEINSLHGVDLELDFDNGLSFVNRFVPTEPTTVVPTETTEATEPKTEPTETTEVTEPKTEPTETTEVTEPKTVPTETTEVTEPKTVPTETTEATEPKTEPTETTEVTEPKTVPTETTEVTEPKTDPTETTEVTEPKTDPTETTEVTEPKTDPTETTEVTEPKTVPTEITEPAKPEPTKPVPPDFVPTGDSHNPLMWIAVLFVSGGLGAASAKVYKRKEE